MIDHHPILKEIDYLHCEICLIKEQIRNVMERLFIDQNQFPDDQFIGHLAKNFIEIYEQFCQINILKKEKGLYSLERRWSKKRVPFRSAIGAQ
jgi:hypothetical protein